MVAKCVGMYNLTMPYICNAYFIKMEKMKIVDNT